MLMNLLCSRIQVKRNVRLVTEQQVVYVALYQPTYLPIARVVLFRPVLCRP